MKPKKISSKEALINSVSSEYKKLAQEARLSDGPFYLFTSTHNVVISSEIEKALLKLPVGYQFISVSQNITEEAANLVNENHGVIIVKSSFYWTDERAKINAR